jgi:hypothetical protein
MQIPLSASIDKVTRAKSKKVIPYAIDVLKKNYYFEYVTGKEFYSIKESVRRKIISRLYDCYSHEGQEQDVDLLLYFDPRSCTVPFSDCCTNCWECCYNPLESMLIPSELQNPDIVITRQDIIHTLLDTIDLLTRVCKNSIKTAPS